MTDWMEGDNNFQVLHCPSVHFLATVCAPGRQMQPPRSGRPAEKRIVNNMEKQNALDVWKCCC